MKIPFFPFFPDEWIASRKRIRMTYEQQGIYMLFLAHAWNDENCTIPPDLESLQTLCPKARIKNIEKVVRDCFEPEGEGLTNRRLKALRNRADDIHNKASYAGKCSANKRFGSTVVEQPLNDRSTNQNQNQNHNQKGSLEAPWSEKNLTADQVSKEKSGVAYREVKTAVDKFIYDGVEMKIEDPLARTVLSLLGNIEGVQALREKGPNEFEIAFRGRYEHREMIAFSRKRKPA